jgi:hypothetical protein
MTKRTAPLQNSSATPKSMIAIFILLLLLLPRVADAQDESPWPAPSEESAAYSVYRQKMTLPPYGLSKVQGMIRRIKSGDNDELAISSKDYQSLSLREKFTYHMINGEAENQNCDAQPPLLDEHKKIFGHLPDFFNDYDWSQRQYSFFKAHKDTVLALIRESTLRSGRMGVNYKQAIVDMQAVSMIPFIISTYRSNPKDHDLLTVLLLLMSESKYGPFLQTPMYKKLYGDGADYRAHLVFNTANEQLIIRRATEFYNTRKR